jgi:hypothetical protein
VTPTGSLTYAWRVDSGSWSSFSGSTTATTGTLSDGSHTFEVKAKDAAGNEDDLSPASDTFTVDTTAPAAPTISAPTSDGTTDPDGDLSLTFSGEGGASFACDLDVTGSVTDSFTSCTSPKTYADQVNNAYTFRVRQTDVAGNTSTNATRTLTVSLQNASPFPGVRHYPSLGVKKGAGVNPSWRYDADLIDEQYECYVGSSAANPSQCSSATTNEQDYLDLDSGDGERYWFTGGRKFMWSDVLHDQTDSPSSRAQAQDPDWCNYKWNTGCNSEAAQNHIQTMINESSAIAADKAKYSIVVATTATSEQDPVPSWVETQDNTVYGADLTWTDGQNKVHVRIDKSGGWQAIADFLQALTAKYGDNEDIASITHGEYFTNPDGGGMPLNSTQETAYYQNAILIWDHWIDNAPEDANGDRMELLQSQPIVQGGVVTAADISDAGADNTGMGVSGSGPTMFTNGQLYPIRRALYGDVPLNHLNDVGPLGQSTNWPAIADPFGFGANTNHALEYQHVVWNYATEGSSDDLDKMTLDSITMSDDTTYRDDWHLAFGKFGPNGTHVSQWGQLPNEAP